MTARDVGKTAPRGREAPLLDLALVSNSGISLPYPRYIRKATALACPSQVRATSPVKRPRLWGSEVRAPVALICQYIDRHKERFGGLTDLPVRAAHNKTPLDIDRFTLMPQGGDREPLLGSHRPDQQRPPLPDVCADQFPQLLSHSS